MGEHLSGCRQWLTVRFLDWLGEVCCIMEAHMRTYTSIFHSWCIWNVNYWKDDDHSVPSALTAEAQTPRHLLVQGLVVDVQVLVHQLRGSHNYHHFSILFLSIPILRISEFLLKVKNFFFIALLSPQCQTVISFYSVYVLFQLLMFARKGEMIGEDHCLAFGNLSRKSLTGGQALLAF